MENLQEKICDIVKSNMMKGEMKELKFDTDLSTVGMDSIMFIRNIVAIEEVFEIEIPDDYLLISTMNTVEKITDIVKTVLEMQSNKSE